MKLLLSIVLIVAVVFVVYLFWQGMQSKSGQAPGLTANGQLSRCGEKPNCRCTEYAEDASHFSAPLPLNTSTAVAALARMKTVIQAEGGEIITENTHYLAATFTSAVFGFVDDLELRVDAESGVMHLRSASRVGYSDMGANQKRINALIAAYEATE